MSLGSAINTLGVEHYPDEFAGAEVLPNGQVVVYVVPGAAGTFVAALPPPRDTPVGPSYLVKEVAHSWAALGAMTMRIAHDDAWRQASGIELSQWGPDLKTNKVLIFLRHYDSSAAEVLYERYGRELVAVSTESKPGLARRC